MKTALQVIDKTEQLDKLYGENIDNYDFFRAIIESILSNVDNALIYLKKLSPLYENKLQQPNKTYFKKLIDGEQAFELIIHTPKFQIWYQETFLASPPKD